MQTHVAVTGEPLDPGRLTRLAGSLRAGATVVFVGTVRDHSPGKEGVTHLEYEAFGERVKETLSVIVAEAAGRWPLEGVAVEHREGRVDAGEPSVVVASSGAKGAAARCWASLPSPLRRS